MKLTAHVATGGHDGWTPGLAPLERVPSEHPFVPGAVVVPGWVHRAYRGLNEAQFATLATHGATGIVIAVEGAARVLVLWTSDPTELPVEILSRFGML